MIRILGSQALGWAIVVGVGLVTALISYLMYRHRDTVHAMVQRLGGGERLRSWAENTVLGSMAMVAGLGMFYLAAPGFVDRLLETRTQLEQTIRIFALLSPLLGGLLAARWIQSRALGIWTIVVIVFGGAALNFFLARNQFLTMMNIEDPNSGIVTSAYIVPTLSVAAIYLVIPILYLMVAIGCYSVWPRWYAFLFGGAVLPALIMLTLGFGPLVPEFLTGKSSPPWQGPGIYSVTMLLALGAIWFLPSLRAGVLRISSGMDRGERDYGLHAIGKFVFVGLFSAQLLLTVGLVIQSAQFGRLITDGPPRKPFSPALVNAWDSLQTRFDKVQSPQLDPDPLYESMLGDGQTTITLHLTGLALKELAPHRTGLAPKDVKDLPEARRVLTPTVRKALQSPPPALAQLEQDFAAASKADYLSANDGLRYSQTSFLNLRTAARWHGLKVVSETIGGNWRAAVKHIRVLYGYSALEMDGPLVAHMIQAAIRAIGKSAATFYWQEFHSNREAMMALAEVLNRTAPGNRRSFPAENILRHEGLDRTVLPYAELALPAFVRATTVYQRESTSFDALRLATAAALYRLDRGDWPGDLQQLVPTYIENIPGDGFEGKPLIYEVQADRLVIDSERSRRDRTTKSPRVDLTQLPPFLLNAESQP